MNEKPLLKDSFLQAMIWVVCVFTAGLLHPMLDEFAEFFKGDNEFKFGNYIIDSYGLMFVSASVSTGIFVNYVYTVKVKNLNQRVLHGFFFFILLTATIVTYNNISYPMKETEYNTYHLTAQISIFYIAILYIVYVKFLTIVEPILRKP